jgi:hypothetical protein
VRTAAATPAAHWTTVRLPHNLDRKDHQGAEFAATVRIWLVILALSAVMLAAIISSIVEIIRTEHNKDNINSK